VSKLVLVSAFGAAFLASPATSDAPNWEGFAQSGVEQTSDKSGYTGAIPSAALLSGMVLMALSNRRRNRQRVLC
jgi:hypothetical protein